MNQQYKHAQIGTLIISALGIPIIIEIAVIFSPAQIEKAGILIMSFTAIVFLVCLILFYKLTVEITDEKLRFWFGPGVISKSIKMDQIAHCEPVRISWWHGWGIHMTPNGWLYNVSGMWVVLIELKSGKKMCIGTDEPDILAQVINANIKPTSAQAT